MDYLTLALGMAILSALSALACLPVLVRVLRQLDGDESPRSAGSLPVRAARRRPACGGHGRRRSLPPEMVALLMRQR